jgi:inosine-uridine nucleoside N-ribohydrolase
VPPSPNPLDAALDLLKRSVEAGAAIVGIGPYTNLALLEARWPGILRHAAVYLMGFNVDPPPAGFPQWGHEHDYNVQMDVASAAGVLRACEPTLVPLEVSVQTALRRAHLPRLRSAGPLGALIAHQAEAFARDERNEAVYGQTCAGLPDDLINFQHDPLACAVALGWEGARTESIPLRLETTGGWLRARRDGGGKPTRVVTGVDGSRFGDWWLDVVTGARVHAHR